MQVSQIPPHTFGTVIPYVLLGAQLMLLAPTLLMLVPGIFYILTLRNALLKCAPESRTIDAGKIWLLLIPFFNLGWHFVVVLNMATSLRNEFTRRGIAANDLEPGKLLGLAMCILLACSFVPSVHSLRSPD